MVSGIDSPGSSQSCHPYSSPSVGIIVSYDLVQSPLVCKYFIFLSEITTLFYGVKNGAVLFSTLIKIRHFLVSAVRNVFSILSFFLDWQDSPHNGRH